MPPNSPKRTAVVSHCRYKIMSAHVAVQKRYARWPMASPSTKYSKSASSITSAITSATTMVEPQSTRPTTTGINTAAVATLFQVMKDESPVLVPEHYITLRGENIKGQISVGKK